MASCILVNGYSEFDLDERVWTVPDHRTKNGTAHVVPLSALAMDLLVEIRRLSSGSEFVFPSPKGNGHRAVRSLSRAVVRRRETIGVPDWTPHDLRRTVRTWLGKLGIPPHIAEKVINHADGRLMRTYDRYTYLPEKQAALDAWSQQLRALVEGSSGD